MAKKKVPEELEAIWSPEVESAFFDLNNQQRKFVLGIADGKTQCDAYREAYDKVSSDEAVYPNSSRLIRIDKIQAILKKLYGENICSLIKARKRLDEGCDATKTVFSKLNEPMDITDFGERRKNAAELLKLAGEYVEKIEHSGTVSIAQQIIEAHGE